MDYTALASQEQLEKVSSALSAHNFKPQILENGAAALAKLKEMTPAGASVMNGSSRTLEEIGFVEYLKAGEHGWNNLHAGILAEKDPEKQAQLRTYSVVSDYYFGSAHAVTETGEIVIASNTGSQLPHIAYTSPNLILVVGAQKIVPNIDAAFQRIREHIVPLEEVNMQQKYGGHTFWSKTLIYNGENAGSKRSINVLLVKEKLGF